MQWSCCNKYTEILSLQMTLYRCLPNRERPRSKLRVILAVAAGPCRVRWGTRGYRRPIGTKSKEWGMHLKLKRKFFMRTCVYIKWQNGIYICYLRNKNNFPCVQNAISSSPKLPHVFLTQCVSISFLVPLISRQQSDNSRNCMLYVICSELYVDG